MQAWHADCVGSKIRSNISDESADASKQYRHCCWHIRAFLYISCLKMHGPCRILVVPTMIFLPAGHLQRFAERNTWASLPLDLGSCPVHSSRSSGCGIMPSTNGRPYEGLLA